MTSLTPGPSEPLPGGSSTRPSSFRIVEVNTLLTGGGTDDRSVKTAGALHRAGHEVWLAGPRNEEYSHVAGELGLRTYPLRTRGLRRWLLPLQIARLLNRQRIQIPAFELGATLAEARGPVPLNHPHCARFCVLGGGACSGR